MVIGICDDLRAAVLELKGIVEEYCRKKEIRADIMVFERGEEAILNIDIVDILFLDMEMPGMDGIETGREILKRKKDCKIIMETSHEERFKEAFYIKAYRFASKPFSIPEIESCLDDAIGSFIECEVVELWENRKMRRILQKDILFLKAYDGYVEAYVGGRIMRKDISLNKMGEKKKAMILCGLCMDMKVIILDESSNGLDIDAQANLKDIIKTLSKKLN